MTSTAGGPDKVTFFDYSTSGDTRTLSLASGGTGSMTTKYTATPTTFVMTSPSNPNQVQTYEKK